MHARPLLFACAFPIVTLTLAQDASVRMGTPFNRTVKGFSGDLQLVVNGTVDASGMPVLFVQEGAGYKALRLDASLKPAEELSLVQQPFTGGKWDAVSSILAADGLHVLFVMNTKKSADYGIGTLSTNGTLSIQGFHKVTTFDQQCVFDPGNTTCKKTLPDLILYDNGAAYDQSDRIVRSPDGAHYLVNYYTHEQKGSKKFWYACLDKDFNLEWSGMKDLSFPDLNSDVHQIEIDNSGRILLLTYVFACATPDRASDKMCHETHLTILSDQGTRMKDLLIDKDFVSSLRIMPRDDGKVMIALRYGALTGQPGMLLSLDTAITKLKATPLVDQRVAAIRKTKLTVFGMPAVEQGKKAPVSRQAKVPDEIIDLLPAGDGTLLIEGFRDPEMEVSKGDGTAIRQLHGALRVTCFDAKDSIRWQRVVDRSFMSTAGEAYGCAAFALTPAGLVLVYNNTPGGMPAINNAYADTGDGKKKKDKTEPAEASELKLAVIAADGSLKSEGSIATMDKNFTLCPPTLVISTDGSKAWIKGFDRGSQHAYVEFDPRAVVKQ